MNRVLRLFDLHILVLGAIVSVLLIGIISIITFVPGSPRLAPCLLLGITALLVFLEPTIITRTRDKKNHGGVFGYFAANTIVATTYGIACGLIIFGMLPRASLINKDKQNKAEMATPRKPSD